MTQYNALPLGLLGICLSLDSAGQCWEFIICFVVVCILFIDLCIKPRSKNSCGATNFYFTVVQLILKRLVQPILFHGGATDL